MPSINNVNDLPLEVHKAFFDHFDPIERTLVLSTCRRWYDLIMETRAYWREVEVVEGDSKEKMMRILQVFDQRSHGSLVKVVINREMETKEELQEVLSAIEPSVGSIKILILRQVSRLNTQTRTFARRMPQLQSFSSLNIPIFSGPFVHKAGLRALQTGSLDDFQEEEEVKWLSQLEFLGIINISSERTLWLILNSCKASLVDLVIGSFNIQENGEFESGERIVMDVLATLGFLRPNVSTLPLVVPALKTLQCTLLQAEAMEAPSLECMRLILEEDEDEDWDWEEDQEQVDGFIEGFKTAVQEKPELTTLVLEGRSSNFELQSQGIIQALLISDENEKEIILPNLRKLCIGDFEEDVLDLNSLATLAISRVKYFFEQHLLKLGNSKINMDTLSEESRESVAQFFSVDLDPVDPSLKDGMVEQYLKMKESMFENWIKELKSCRSDTNLEG